MRQSDETMFPASPDNVNLTSNWLVGVIDDPQQAEQAERELLQVGFSRDHVLLLRGDEATQRLRTKDEQRGPLGWLLKVVSDVTSDVGEYEAKYADEARAGHAIINVQVSEQDRMERARQIIDAHGGHYLKHFGDWVISDLS
ncbi:MAG TPA: hypothetical protein VFQ25_00215 [Ktedonobacterales bacterium]|nr:hypothetical protein [Ktedonobacterales bacterium]